MNPVELVLSKLQDPKSSGSGGWAARCPAHRDRNPSLSLSEGEDGRALIHCHSGCSTESVVKALGLKLADLMPARSATRANPVPRPTARPTFPSAADAVKHFEQRHGKHAALWTYHSATGSQIGQVIRWNTPTGKRIRPISLSGERWVLGGMPTPRPLYRLPDLLARPDEPIHITEGEKAADAAAELGLLATTSPHGAQSAAKADWSPLAGRDVVILPDADSAGAQYAADVASLLSKLSPPPSVRILQTGAGGLDLQPDSGGDIHDWIAQQRELGHDPAAMRQTLQTLIQQATTPAATEDQSPTTPAVETYQPFPTEALPEPARSFISTCARAIGCDESFIALPLLAALASAIGNSRRVQLKRGWTEPAILWAAIVGDSGTLKSPAMEVAHRAIHRRQHHWLKDHDQIKARFEIDKALWEKQMALWKRTRSQEDPPPMPDIPKTPRCICDDVTIEALASLLQDNPRGLLLACDELAGWMGGFNRYSNGKGNDVAKWLEMFGGRSIRVDRKTSGAVYVPRAAVSVCGSIQPATLARALGVEHRENGLAARLLLACPPRIPKRWTEADIPPEMELRLQRLIDRLFDLQPDTDDAGDPQPILIPLSADGKAAWIDYYNAHSLEQEDLTGDLSAAWSKLEGYAARLALLIHFIRWANEDPTLTSEHEIDSQSVRAGVELSRWFGHEARRTYAIINESDDERTQRRLVELIHRKGGRTTVRELRQTSRMFKCASDAQAALQTLVQTGQGRWVMQPPRKQGGRPTQVLHLITPAPSTKPPQNAPSAPTKPPLAMQEGGFVDVGAVDTPNYDMGDWGEA